MVRFITCISTLVACFCWPDIANGQFDPTDPEPISGYTRRFEPVFVGAGGPTAAAVSAAANAGTWPGGLDPPLDALKAGEFVNRDPSLTDATVIREEVTHQPLIHIKARVIDVDRADTLTVASILDYVSSMNSVRSLTKGNSLNGDGSTNNFRNTRGATRFPNSGLLGVGSGGALSTTGSGLLVNLTSEHINYIASLLATEFHGDVVTSPQVTTLNGKNVVFRSGDKVPFFIGTNAITGDTNNLQQFFYKHVGTFISVTPQIVNWGPNGEGHGTVPSTYEGSSDPEFIKIRTTDIRQGNIWAVLDAINKNPGFKVSDNFKDKILKKLPLPTDDNGSPLDEAALTAVVLNELNSKLGCDGYTRSVLSSELQGTVAIPSVSECTPCSWHPEDCTINLNIVVRLSNAAQVNLSTLTLETPPSNAAASNTQVATNVEQNVRAISNVVQVKSGHGVVMGGLISMRDQEEVSKVPVLGDIPGVGFFFRSKDSRKTKSETIIFVEAQVLPDNGPIARNITSRDYCNGRQHLNRDICHTDLHEGLRRAGLTVGYLPAPSCAEEEYWHCYHTTMCVKRCRMIRDEVCESLQ